MSTLKIWSLTKKKIIYDDDGDGKAIDLAFCKGESNDRKEWIKNFEVWKSNKNKLFIFRKRFIIIVKLKFAIHFFFIAAWHFS